MSAFDRTCDTCGVTLVDADAGQACPRCQGRLVASAVHVLSMEASSADGATTLATRIEIPAEVQARYELGRVLGRGGMGMVVHATERASGDTVAIKFLTRLDDDGALTRFLREGEILRSIRHPNVLTVREVGAAGHSPYLVCDLLTGGNLRQRIDREGRLPAATAVQIALGMLSGLAALHERGIVHRDIKPQNILFDGTGKPLLADLGLAKFGGPDAEHLTKTGALLGTPKYMAPEQANGEPTSTPADIYASGLVIYEMLAGRPPFDDPSIFILLMDQIQSPPPPLTDNVPDVPEALAAVVHRALAKKPAERQETASQLAAELKRAIAPRSRTGYARVAGKSTRAAATLAGAEDGSAPAADAQAGSGSSTRPLTFAGVVTLLMMLGLAMLFQAPRDGGPPVVAGGSPRTPASPGPIELPVSGTDTPVVSVASVRASSAPARPAPPTLRARPAPLTVRRPSLVVPVSTGPWLTTTATPRVLWRLPAERCQHPAPLAALSVVDSQTISASADGLLCMWDAHGMRRRILRLRGGVPTALALAAYRATCATASDDGTVRVWDLSTDPPRPVLEQSGLSARQLALSPYGDRLAVLRPDGTVTLVEVGQAPRSLAESRGTAQMVFTRSGDLLITRDGTRAIKVWLAATGVLSRIIVTEAPAGGTLYATDERVLLLSGGGIHSWSLKTGERLASGWSPGESTTALGVSADGATLFAGSVDGVRRFTLATSAPQEALDGGLGGAVAIAVAEDGRGIATGAADGALSVGERGARLTANEPAQGLRLRIGLSPDGRTLALATTRTLTQLDLPSRASRTGPALFAGQPEAATPLAGLLVTDGGRSILAAAGARAVRRELPSGQDQAITAIRPPDRVTALAQTPDGRSLAVAGGGSLLIWTDFASGAPPVTAPVPARQTVMTLGFDPSGTRVAAAGGPVGFLSVFAPGTGADAGTYATGDPVRHAALDAACARLAVATLDRVEVFGAGTGARLGSTPATVVDRGALALLGSGGPAVWSDTKGDLARWSVADGPGSKLEGVVGVITQVVGSADGRVLATLASEGTLTVWQLR